MTELVLLRHGRTDWNAQGRFQGQSDSQLDRLGHAQAAAVAPVLAALSPSVLWSSDSDRARATAAYVADACGLAPTYDVRLREYDFGDRAGLLRTEFEAMDPDGFRAYLSSEWDLIAGVEKYAAVAARISAALSELADSLPDDGRALVVSHGAAIRTAVATMLGWPQALAPTLRGMGNCGYAVLRRTEPSGPWRLAAWNLTAPPDFTEPETVG